MRTEPWAEKSTTPIPNNKQKQVYEEDKKEQWDWEEEQLSSANGLLLLCFTLWVLTAAK